MLNAGQATQSLQALDADGDVVQTIPYTAPEVLYAGVAWAPDAKHAYAGAGGDNKIRVYQVSGRHLTEGASIPIPTTTAMKNPYPAGLAVALGGDRLFVARSAGRRLQRHRRGRTSSGTSARCFRR